jgi:hypothetical protein
MPLIDREAHIEEESPEGDCGELEESDEAPPIWLSMQVVMLLGQADMGFTLPSAPQTAHNESCSEHMQERGPANE